MEDSILTSPVKNSHKPGQMWPPSVRAVIRAMHRRGDGYGTIYKETGVLKSTVKRIIAGESSDNSRKGKVFKSKLLKEAEIKKIFRFVGASWTNRTASWVCIKAELGLYHVSTTTICKTIRQRG